MAFDKGQCVNHFSDGLASTGNGSTHEWDGQVLSRSLFNPASNPSVDMKVAPAIEPETPVV